MKNLFVLAAIMILIVSCNKDNDSDQANPEDLRVYTATSYYDNGTIQALHR